MGKVDLQKYAVPVEKLYWRCPEELFQFECTTDIEPLKEFIGQDRALDSINFGLAVERQGYNLFLTGLTGTGKAVTIKSRIERFISEKKAQGIKYQLYDWCYVYNFSDPDRPNILKLPQGIGKSFRNHMEELLKTLKEEIPKALSSEEYTKRKQEVMEEHQKKYQAMMDTLEQEARDKSLMVQISPMGAAVVPLIDGRPMSREEFHSLPEKEKDRIESRRLEMMRRVDETYSHLREMKNELAEKMKEIKVKIGEFAISRPFEELFKIYSEFPEIIDFLSSAKEYTISKLDIFIQPSMQQMPGMQLMPGFDSFASYKVNVFVDNSSSDGPLLLLNPILTGLICLARLKEGHLWGLM
ncbi:MAG: Lon-like protease helical domain-containing protein [Thermodesulfovibrionales bacterium]